MTSTANLSLTVHLVNGITAEFVVRKLEGEEEISRLFSFELDLDSDNTERVLADYLDRTATLTMTRLFGEPEAEAQIYRHGILADIRLTGRTVDSQGGWRRLYHARLVPRLWRASLQRRSQIFVSQTAKNIVKGILTTHVGANGHDDSIPTPARARTADDYRDSYVDPYANLSNPPPPFPVGIMPTDAERQAWRHYQEVEVLKATERATYEATLKQKQTADATTDTSNLAKQPSLISRQMVMQYQESDLDFISRWCEALGVYFTVSHGDDANGADKVMLYDHNAFSPVVHHAAMNHRDNLGVVTDHSSDDNISGMISAQRRLPRTVILQGYDYNQPSKYLRSECRVAEAESTQPATADAASARGTGEHFEYNAHFTTQEQGDTLAKIRAQELLCREVEFSGISRSPFFAVGQTFSLANHYDTTLNGATYLIVKLRHYAEQPVGAADHDGKSWTYHNEFVAIPAERAFRALRRAPWPSINSMLTGKIHAPDRPRDGDASAVNKDGTYLVQLPFAINATDGTGQATCSIRMARPYAGSDFGMHFPLHDGTEVTLAFLEGDPDRPVITGALFDGTHEDPVNDTNATQGGIKTKSGSALAFEDTGENSRVTLTAGSGGAAVAVGTLGKSHTGALTLNQVQLYASKLDLFAGFLSSHTSTIIINNAVIKWMAVASTLNALFMAIPAVSKTGQGDKDPILGTSVSPSEHENIEAANMTVLAIVQTLFQLTFANVMAAKGAYAAEMSLITGDPSWTTKAGMIIMEFLKTWPFMLVGGKGRDGVSITAAGLINKIDTTALLTLAINVSIFAKGSVKITAEESILGLAKKQVQFVAPAYQFMVGNQLNPMAAVINKKGSINLNDSSATIHHGTKISLVAGTGPLPPLRSDVSLTASLAALRGIKAMIAGWEEVTLLSGPMASGTSKLVLKGTGDVDLEGLTKITVKSMGEVEISAGAGQAKIAMGPTGIKLSFGAGSIEIGPAGITIKGLMVKIEGSKVDINGKAMTEINGGMLKVNSKPLVGLG